MRPPPRRRAGSAPTPPASTSLTSDVTPSSPTQVKILVPGNHLMVDLLGQRDELLRVVEDAFPVHILVRGNEITVSGDTADDRDRRAAVRGAGGAARAGPRARPRRRGSQHRDVEVGPAPDRRCSPPRSCAAARPCARRPRARSATSTRCATTPITFGIGPAGTGKSYLAVALAVQALQAKEVNRIILTRPGGRGRRAARVPARRHARQGRPVPAPALRRALRHARPRRRGAAHGARHHRGRAARVHARPHAQRLVHHPRRGAEHDAPSR